MKEINPKDQSERQNYKLLTGTILPRPIAFVTTVGKNGIVNGAPFSYFNIVTADPPMISLSIQRNNGKIKDTARNILDMKEFVVHIVDEDNVEEINKSAATLKSDESELEEMKVTEVDSRFVNVPSIKESKVRFECVLEKHVPIGDENPTADLFIAKVLIFHIADEVYEADGKITVEKLEPVSRLAGNHYAKLGEKITLVRPE